MYNTTLLAVALQDWERYSNHAIALRDAGEALALGSVKQLHVLSVYHYDEEPHGRGLTLEMTARASEDFGQRLDADMRQKLAEYVGPLTSAGITITSHLEVGNPREVIVRVAQGIGADVLLLGSHSKRGLIDVTLGGAAQQISSHAPCPVILVSPKAAH